MERLPPNSEPATHIINSRRGIVLTDSNRLQNAAGAKPRVRNLWATAFLVCGGVIVAIGAFQRWEITSGFTGEGFPETGIESGVGRVVVAFGIATVVCALVPPLRPGAWIGAVGALILTGAKVVSTLPYVVPLSGEGPRPGRGLSVDLSWNPDRGDRSDRRSDRHLAPIETRLAVGPAVRPAERFSPPLASPPGLVASPEIFPVSG
jgi:hypothetical protein